MLIRRLRYWMESARRSEGLREEMELHLAEKAAELEADGMTAERARAEARRRFGNVGLKHEESREIWKTAPDLRGLRPVIWPRSSASVDASGRHAHAEEWPRGRIAPPRAARSGGCPNRDVFFIWSPRGCLSGPSTAALRPTGIRPREHPSVLVEAAPGRASRPGDRHFLRGPAQHCESIPGVSSATLSQSSIISAGRVGSPIRGTMKIGAVTIEDAHVLAAGPRFLTTMQIPILAGREIDDRDQPGFRPVAVISERLARLTSGTRIRWAGPSRSRTRNAISKSSASRLTCGTVV